MAASNRSEGTRRAAVSLRSAPSGALVVMSPTYPPWRFKMLSRRFWDASKSFTIMVSCAARAIMGCADAEDGVTAGSSSAARGPALSSADEAGRAAYLRSRATWVCGACRRSRSPPSILWVAREAVSGAAGVASCICDWAIIGDCCHTARLRWVVSIPTTTSSANTAPETAHTGRGIRDTPAKPPHREALCLDFLADPASCNSSAAVIAGVGPDSFDLTCHDAIRCERLCRSAASSRHSRHSRRCSTALAASSLVNSPSR